MPKDAKSSTGTRIDKPDFLASRIRWLEHNRAPLLAVLHAGENCGFDQFRLVFQFFHGDLDYSQA